jgi:hypothetical protein
MVMEGPTQVSVPKGISNSEMMFYEERFPLSVIMNNFQTKGQNGTLVEHLPSQLEALSSNHRVCFLAVNFPKNKRRTLVFWFKKTLFIAVYIMKRRLTLLS